MAYNLLINVWQKLYFGGTAELVDLVESRKPLLLHVIRQQLDKYLYYGMNK